jgi:hypothetical protein
MLYISDYESYMSLHKRREPIIATTRIKTHHLDAIHHINTIKKPFTVIRCLFVASLLHIEGTVFDILTQNDIFACIEYYSNILCIGRTSNVIVYLPVGS